MLDKHELTPAQVAHSKLAGIPGDRPGLGDDYPRMMYRDGKGADHKLLDMPLPIQGHTNVETAIVYDALEEEEAAEHGWTRTIDGSTMPTMSDKDALIEELQAQLLAQTTLLSETPRRGRPPKAVEGEQEQ